MVEKSILHLMLSMYVVFFILDIAKACKDTRYYKLKYFEVRADQKFMPLFLNNQKWSILAVICIAIWSLFIFWVLT
jgi:hypothetical protein